MPTPSVLSALKKLRLLLTREEKIVWLGIFCFALFSSLFEMMTASVIIIFAQVLNQPEVGKKYLALITPTPVTSEQTIFYCSLIIGGIYMVKNCVAAAEVFYQHFSLQKMNYCFKNKMLHRYTEADYGFTLTRNSSMGMQVVEGDVEKTFSSGMISLANIVSESIVFISLVGMIIYMNPTLSVIIFSSGFFLTFAMVRFILPKFYIFGQKSQEATLHSIQKLMHFFHGFKEILLSGKRHSFIAAYQHHSYHKARIHALQSSLSALPRIIIEVLFVGLFVLTIAMLCLKGENAVAMMGLLGGYLYIGFRLMPGLNRMINQLNAFKAVIPFIERVYQEYTHISFKENYKDISNLQFKKSLVLKGVYFNYLNAERAALFDINLEIKKGECIGIVGTTGSGKSTLIDVILGLLIPHKGSIRVDNKYPVNAYQWHHKIGYVPQHIYLLDDTIEANIIFTDEPTNVEQLNKAINAAQLRVFIDQLPHGVATIVGERGARLSGGERQRIAIARALYRNPEILIFDEATSALDNQTEANVIKILHTISRNRTVLMVAHRLTTLQECDRIIVMDKGRIKAIQQYIQLEQEKVVHYV